MCSRGRSERALLDGPDEWVDRWALGAVPHEIERLADAGVPLRVITQVALHHAASAGETVAFRALTHCRDLVAHVDEPRDQVGLDLRFLT